MRCEKHKKIPCLDVITKYKCQICEKEQFSMSYPTPKICWDCSKRFNKCEICGADLDKKEV